MSIDPHSWNYDDGDDKCGPCAWVQPTKPELQSPIALTTTVPISPEGHHFCDLIHLSEKKRITFTNYDKPIEGRMVNTGHSVQFLPTEEKKTGDEASGEAPTIQGGELPQAFRFVQFHYHWAQCDGDGSEHTLNGRHFPAELHLVHQGVTDPTQLAVLGILLEMIDPKCDEKKTNANEASSNNVPNGGAKLEIDEVKALHQIKHFEEKSEPFKLRLSDKLSPTKITDEFIRYQGSLTTPPCTENVVWTVFTQPGNIPREHMTALREIRNCHGKKIALNARRLQKVNGRKVQHMVCGAPENEGK